MTLTEISTSLESLDYSDAWTLDFFVRYFLSKRLDTAGVKNIKARLLHGLSINRPVTQINNPKASAAAGVSDEGLDSPLLYSAYADAGASIRTVTTTWREIWNNVRQRRDDQDKRIRADFYEREGMPLPNLADYDEPLPGDVDADAEENYWRPKYQAIEACEFIFVGFSESDHLLHLLRWPLMGKLRSWAPMQAVLAEWCGAAPELDRAVDAQLAKLRKASKQQPATPLRFVDVRVFRSAEAPKELRKLVGLGTGGQSAKYPYADAIDLCHADWQRKEGRPQSKAATLKAYAEKVQEICGRQPDVQAIESWAKPNRPFLFAGFEKATSKKKDAPNS